MERFENDIFKQPEEINDRMTDMFGLLKELTTSRALEKVLMIEEAKHLITKNVNSISLVKGEEENSDANNVMTGDSIEKLTDQMQSAEKELTQAEEEEAVEAPSSQPVGYYLKHRINEKLIQGLVDNHMFNDSLPGV
ncbi:hypothetical protein Tco_1381599 [Tanacetum coccineum]